MENPKVTYVKTDSPDENGASACCVLSMLYDCLVRVACDNPRLVASHCNERTENERFESDVRRKEENEGREVRTWMEQVWSANKWSLRYESMLLHRVSVVSKGATPRHT